MKRAYLSVLLAVVLPMFSVYAQGMRGGGSRGSEGRGSFSPSHGNVGGQFHSSRGNFGGNHFIGRGHGSGRGYFYGRGRRVVFFGGYGYGYPYYPYAYYYPNSGYYASDSGYSDMTPSDTYSAPVETSADQGTQDNAYTNQDAQSYYQLGYQWGGELKQYHGTVDQLVAYLKAYIVNASPAQQDAFRSGFIASTAANAATIYDGAMQQAGQHD
jgi:hypothetical protein